VAEFILFDIHKMSSPIEHSEGRSGVGVQQIPGVLVSARDLPFRNESGANPSVFSEYKVQSICKATKEHYQE
jgi:hypothetical protein